MRRHRRPTAAAVQTVEPRVMLTTIVVDTLSDTAADAAGVPDGRVSLREAIAAANTDAAFGDAPAGSGADKIRFTRAAVPAGSVLRLTQGPLVTSGAVDIHAAGRLTIDAGGVSRALVMQDPGGALLTRVSVTGGAATAGDGGGVLVTGAGDVTLTEVRVSGSRAAGDGGGVAVDVGGRASLLRAELTGNTAGGRGGGVWLRGGRHVLRDSLVSGNAAPDGGGVAAEAGERIVLRGGDVFENAAEVDGGGVWATGEAVTLVGTFVRANTAGRYGGGVAFAGVTRGLVTGGRVRGNVAAAGGGVYADGGLTTVFDSRLEFNRSQGTAEVAAVGGGLFLDTPSGGRASVRGSSVVGNQARYGGGLAAESAEPLSAVLYVSDSELRKNRSRDYEGTAEPAGVPAGGGGLFSRGQRVTVLRTGLSQNSASGAVSPGGNTTAAGGGGLLLGGRAIFEDATLTRNDAGLGGGLYAQGGRLFTRRTDFGGDNPNKANAANSRRFPSGFGRGGGVALADASFTAVGGLFGWNFAFSSGGAIDAFDSDVRLFGVTLSRNSVRNGNTSETGGGAVRASGGSVALTGCLVEDNYLMSTRSSGGGLYVRTPGEPLRLTNTHVRNNESRTSGGGVEAVETAVLMSGGSLVGNRTGRGSGGGIRAFTPFTRTRVDLVELGGVRVADNAAAYGGGGVSAYGRTRLRVEGGTFVGNAALSEAGGDGGALSAASLTVARATFTGNTSRGFGGAVSVGVSGVFRDTTFEGNFAARGGGGLHVGPDALARLTDTRVVGNSADANGGGVLLERLGFTDRVGRLERTRSPVEDNTPDDVFEEPLL